MREEIQNLLKSAPGPSPWYLRAFGPKITTKFGSTLWEDAGQGATTAGKIILHAERKQNLAVFGFYNWVSLFQDGYLMSYTQTRTENDVTAPIHLSLYDPNEFEPFHSVNRVCQEMNEKKTSVYHKGGLIVSCDVPTVITGTSCEYEFPAPFSDMEEILLLCQSSGIGTGNDWDSSNLGLMVAHPSRRKYEIFPQDWFNHGSYDFGYQWVTRVMRHPQTGKIIGDGIRLSGFILDDTLRKVEQWL